MTITNSMKALLVVGVVLFSSVMFATPAKAATTQTGLLIDGNITNTIPLGNTYEGKLSFINTGNSTVDSLWIEIPGTGFPGECKDVVDQKTTGPHTLLYTGDTIGATEGSNHDVKITPYGAPPGQANNTCDPAVSPAGVSHTFQNKLTITESQNVGDNINNTGSGSGNGSSGGSTNGSNGGNGGSSGSGNASTTPPAWFVSWLANWEATHNSTSTTDAMCVAFKSNLTRAVSGQRSPWNSVLQGFLIGAGESIPALNDPSVPFGFFGTQTAAAVSHFQLAHNCQ